MPQISIIIVNFNTCAVLKECLANLQNLKTDTELTNLFEVLVVDNGSTDGSCDMVKHHFSFVTLIQSTNLGLAVGGNLGARHAKGAYLLFLGSDAFPTKEFLLGAFAYMDAAPDVAICTPKLVDRAGVVDFDAHRGFPTPWNAFCYFTKLYALVPNSKLLNGYFLGHKTSDFPHEIDACISHFMFVRASAFLSINGWDEDYFVFGEDIDLCYRLKQAGFKIMYLPTYLVVHYKSTGIPRKKTKPVDINASNSSAIVRKTMRWHSVNAMRLFYTKHYLTKYPKLVTKLVYLALDFLQKLRAYT